MIKAVRKLKKLWPRKKKRKRTHYEPYYYYTPPSTYYTTCCCSSSTSAPQPSAPPLPPWLDPYPTYEPISLPNSEMAFSSQTQFPSQEIAAETNGICTNDSLPDIDNNLSATAATTTTTTSTTTTMTTIPSSYQQYLVPEPVYGVPVVKMEKREKSGGFFGCFIIDFGVSLIRCFCPCFHIKEVA